jgi:hypothetical protein
MENLLNLSPVQIFFALALNAWMFVIFPIIVLRKINYMTELLEAQFEQNDQSSDEAPKA